MTLRKPDWLRVTFLALVAVGVILTALNVIALASREDREQDVLKLLSRCKLADPNDADEPGKKPPGAKQKPDRKEAGQGKPAPGKPASKPAASRPEARTKPTGKAPTDPAGPNKNPGTNAAKGAGNPKPAKPGAKDAKKAKPPKSFQDEQADRIAKRNLFSPPRPKPQFTAKLLGVLGDQAIFHGGKLLKIGQSIAGAKLTKIGPDWVEVLWEGKPKRLTIFTGAPGGGPGRPTPGRPTPGGPPAPPSARPGPPPGVIVSGGPARMGSPPGPISPEMMERIRNARTPAERQAILMEIQKSAGK
jgi:hypothetical protein